MEDRQRFFASRTCSYAVVIEHGWLRAMLDTPLYLYEFDPAGFRLQDEAAGYYVAATSQTPIHKERVDGLLDQLARRGVESG